MHYAISPSPQIPTHRLQSGLKITMYKAHFVLVQRIKARASRQRTDTGAGRRWRVRTLRRTKRDGPVVNANRVVVEFWLRGICQVFPVTSHIQGDACRQRSGGRSARLTAVGQEPRPDEPEESARGVFASDFTPGDAASGGGLVQPKSPQVQCSKSSIDEVALA